MFTLYDTISIGGRCSFVRNLYRLSVSNFDLDDSMIDQFTRQFLMQDGVLILEILYRNGSAVCTTRVTNQLFKRYLHPQLKAASDRTQPKSEEESGKIQPKSKEESDKTQPKFESSDV